MDQDQIPLAPLAGWDLMPISALDAVMLRLHYLTHATQQPTEAHHTPHFVMNAARALELCEALRKAVAALQTGPPPGTGLPKH